jgi:hypothetical protein
MKTGWWFWQLNWNAVKITAGKVGSERDVIKTGTNSVISPLYCLLLSTICSVTTIAWKISKKDFSGFVFSNGMIILFNTILWFSLNNRQLAAWKWGSTSSGVLKKEAGIDHFVVVSDKLYINIHWSNYQIKIVSISVEGTAQSGINT